MPYPVGKKLVHVVVVLGVFAVFLKILARLFRREMRKFIKLSRKGPIYRLVVWLVGVIVRRVRGDIRPTVAPRPTHSQRTTKSIAVTWKTTPSSRFARDQLVVEALADDGELLVDVEDCVSTVHVEPGATVSFRARAQNRGGCSPWSQPLSLLAHQIPRKGGGRGPNYTWRQTNDAIHVLFDLAPVRARHVDVAFKSTTLSVRVRDDVLLDKATLCKPVRPDDSTWELLGGGRLLLTLDKLPAPSALDRNYWNCLVQGHPTIDTKLLAPSLPDDPFDDDDDR